MIISSVKWFLTQRSCCCHQPISSCPPYKCQTDLHRLQQYQTFSWQNPEQTKQLHVYFINRHITSDHLTFKMHLRSFTHIFLSVVYDGQICSSLCTVSSALIPVLRLIGHVVKTRLIVSPSIYKHNQFSCWLFGPIYTHLSVTDSILIDCLHWNLLRPQPKSIML